MLGVLRSQLRGLTLRGGAFVSNPASTYLSRINHRHALSSFLQVSQFGEFSTCTDNELKEDAKGSGGISNSFRMAQKRKRNARKQIAKGDIVDLHDLLFTENRDYLVKYNDNRKVKAEHLAGKRRYLFTLSKIRW
ncbi:hypothetical protein POM88_028134 [Heracleum sosnowskyi]|uniref:Uncharacterized protein n=1 Tax=Heracleum sosnowskyi TaxID=360622 RepID=A0AAD8MM21_9APIA|nr:hypothetical protein POM88_028129 [Heracleum sosnowskyi]KAK1381390.1 hypothetical protein POM88_028134 [Heracleum sosnowskyi]